MFSYIDSKYVKLNICRWNRKGGNVSASEWTTRLTPFVLAWTDARAQGNVWGEHRPFSWDAFQEYLQWYLQRARVHLVRGVEPLEIAPADASGMYPIESTQVRNLAVSTYICIYCICFAPFETYCLFVGRVGSSCAP
jgi:hypothetical protein